MFISEQFRPRDLRGDYCAEFAESIVWSPVSNRFTFWTFTGLCLCDERGRIVPGSRRRNPFPPFAPTQETPRARKTATIDAYAPRGTRNGSFCVDVWHKGRLILALDSRAGLTEPETIKRAESMARGFGFSHFKRKGPK